jgi:hypothetical protein
LDRCEEGQLISDTAIGIQAQMDAEGFTLKPDRTGCRHSYMEGSFCKIGGMSAAKCFTCERLIAWTIETGTPTTRLTWIIEPASGVTAA